MQSGKDSFGLDENHICIFDLFMWWTQSDVAQTLLVGCILAKMSFDDLESTGSGVSLFLQPSERLHELSMHSKCFSCVVDAPLGNVVRSVVLFCGCAWQSCAEFAAVSYQSVLFLRLLWTLWLRYCRAAMFVSKTSTVLVSPGAFRRIQHQGWSNRFFRFALDVSPMKRHGPPLLHHTKRSSIPSRSVADYPLVHDCAKPLPILVWQLVCQPFVVPMVCSCIPYCQNANKFTSFNQPFFSLVILGVRLGPDSTLCLARI